MKTHTYNHVLCDGTTIGPDSVASMVFNADANQPSLRLWVDGKPSGEPLTHIRFREGGHIRWAVVLSGGGDSATIIPTPDLDIEED